MDKPSSNWCRISSIHCIIADWSGPTGKLLQLFARLLPRGTSPEFHMEITWGINCLSKIGCFESQTIQSWAISWPIFQLSAGWTSNSRSLLWSIFDQVSLLARVLPCRLLFLFLFWLSSLSDPRHVQTTSARSHSPWSRKLYAIICRPQKLQHTMAINFICLFTCFVYLQ